ncbi:YcnI family protein [Allostreptomyces psammosilenae]|uniref:Uncharacterized protein YcnI n=1 Tax=Allostreptomyces psammosilenae TaxID=1892865 RepID=A0A853A4S0_9ACTN|nr:YcnI family protein [Allostreptomyces psammosilenae]NYI05488.1 uncharacterized protein YcnI [Allostreptomyces psammosilenae]
MSVSTSPRSLRAATVAATAAAALLLAAVPASAHVSVQPGEAEQGGYATVVFRVPNERDDASTTRLEVTLPADHPLSSVRTQPVPGWEVTVERAALEEPLESHGEQVTEAVSTITWTSTDGAAIAPDTFQEFPVSLGPLPEDADQLVFKAVQTYDSGEVVRWIEEPVEGEPEPETPAPVLSLVPASGDGHGHGTAEADAEAEDDPAETAADASATDTAARTLGVVGIVIGLVGAAIGVFGLRRRSS